MKICTNFSFDPIYFQTGKPFEQMMLVFDLDHISGLIFDLLLSEV